MLALGMFVFTLPTVVYQTLRRQTSWRHASNPRMGERPASQFVGAGDDIITLEGWVSPELIGSAGSLKMLHRMADTGKAYVLVDGTGEVFGAWIITDKSEGHSLFYVNGQSRRVDFSITLKCVDDRSARTLLGDLQLPIGAMDSSILDWSVA